MLPGRLGWPLRILPHWFYWAEASPGIAWNESGRWWLS